MARVAAMGCFVCAAPATVHHVTSNGYQRIARSNWIVIGLCPTHHQIQHGPHDSIEALGHLGFRQRYGFDPLAAAIALAEKYAPPDTISRFRMLTIAD